MLSFQKYFKGNHYQRWSSAKNDCNKPDFIFTSGWGRGCTTGTN